MSDPFVGEIKMFGGNFPPNGWALCQGQLLAISENDTLFNLIGTTYGGDGQETFALPNMASRVAVHMGQGPGITQTYQMGELGGVEQVTITQQQTPAHNHALLTTTSGQANSPQGAYFASVTSTQANCQAYTTDPATTAMIPASVLPVGGNQPHDNIQPTLAINFIISLFGIYPTQN